MSDATFARPDLTTFCRLDGLGLQVVGQRIEPDRAVLACRVVDCDECCHRCGERGVARDTVTRRLAHEPLGWRPTTLLVTIRRYRCPGCGHVWRQDTSRAAEPRARISRAGLRWALQGIVCAHLVACHGDGTTWLRFLPLSWGHRSASYGTTRRVAVAALWLLGLIFMSCSSASIRVSDKSDRPRSRAAIQHENRANARAVRTARSGIPRSPIQAVNGPDQPASGP